MHEVGTALADEAAQRPPRGELGGRRPPRPRDRRELDAGGRGHREVGGRLRLVGIGERDLVASHRLVGRKRAHHLERARPGRFGDMEDAHRGQYAPRPDNTTGSVARRISTSRASDQPATY